MYFTKCNVLLPLPYSIAVLAIFETTSVHILFF